MRMMKKRAAYLFILLANVIILAHAVLHHHHGNRICFDNTHCQSECHSNHLDDHNHDGEKGAVECMLRQFVFLPSGYQNGYFVRVSGGDLPQFPDFQFCLFHHEPLSFLSFSHSFSYLVHNTFHYFSPASAIVGLRAPPVFFFPNEC